nr:unnamed protein product [uncultured bacterium]
MRRRVKRINRRKGRFSRRRKLFGPMKGLTSIPKRFRSRRL